MTSWVKLFCEFIASKENLTRVGMKIRFKLLIKTFLDSLAKHFRSTMKPWNASGWRKIDDSARIWPEMQNKLQSSRVFDVDLFFRMLAAPKLFCQNRNPNKSHDVWGSMTSGALFSREWKRSTYNKSEICLDYLSRAIHIQRKASGATEIDESRLRRRRIYIKIHRRFTRIIAAGNERLEFIGWENW